MTTKQGHEFPGLYDVLYMLEPVEEVSPGWWRLRWRPLWRYTYSAYVIKNLRGSWGLGARSYRGDADNGWGRYWKGVTVEVWLLRWTWHAWVRWKFIVMEEGPFDTKERRPLAIPAERRRKP